VIQQGQVFKLKARGADGRPLWAYRHRLDGQALRQVLNRAVEWDWLSDNRRSASSGSSGATSIVMRAWSTCGARSRTGGWSRPRRASATAPFRCRRRRSRCSTSYRRQRTRSCSRTLGAAASTSAASAAASGSQPNSASLSSRCAASTTCATCTRPSPCAPEYRYSPSRGLGSSIAMIDYHYGHLAHDSRQHAVSLLEALALERAVDAGWTQHGDWSAIDGFRARGSSSTSAGEERTTTPSSRRRNRQPVRSSGGRVEATTGLESAA
jgi:hypothetical protein